MIRPCISHSVSSLSFLPGRRSSISIGSVTLPMPFIQRLHCRCHGIHMRLRLIILRHDVLRSTLTEFPHQLHYLFFLSCKFLHIC